MLVDLTLRHWMLLLTTWLLLRISETVRKIVKALEPPVSAAALLGLRSSRKKSAAPTYKAGFSLPRVAQRTPSTVHSWEALHASRFQVRGKHYVERGPEKGKKYPSTDALGEVVAMDTLKTKKKIWNLLELNHIELPPPTRGESELQTAALLGIVTTPPHAHSSRRVERVVPRVPRDQPDAADADGPHDDERAD